MTSYNPARSVAGEDFMIKSPLLQECRGMIAGGWVNAASGRTIEVRNPATGEHLGDVPDMDEHEATAGGQYRG